MKGKYIVILLFCLILCPFISNSQRYSRSLSIQTDNDSYMLQDDDGYYTNGLMFKYNWSQNLQDSGAPSALHQLEIGQLMYNAKNGSYREKRDIDRPVTAYLYGKYTNTSFSKKENVLQWSIEGGVIGKWAFGRQMQEGIHSVLGMYKPQEWQFQLNPDWGLTGTVRWSPELLTNNSNRILHVKPIATAQVGNMYTNAQAGVVLALGKMNDNSKSIFWNNPKVLSKESFLYIQPKVIYQVYNATIQGGLFKNDPGVVTSRLNRYLFQQHIGYMYSEGKIFYGIATIFENRQAITQRKTQWYGSLQFGVRF